jgi:hypothetical protein
METWVEDFFNKLFFWFIAQICVTRTKTITRFFNCCALESLEQTLNTVIYRVFAIKRTLKVFQNFFCLSRFDKKVINNNVKDCLILNFLSIKFIDKWNKHRKWCIESLSNPKNLEELKINIENNCWNAH